METALVMIEKFKGSFERSWDLRRLVLKKLKKHTRTDNIRFDGFSRASHVTDATDWRVEYPFVVIYPDSEDEVPGIVKALIDLDFVIIPRGGGTGYTGGAVPLHSRSAVINTEKLNRISDVEMRKLEGLDKEVATIQAGAGSVNKKVAEKALPKAGFSRLTRTPTMRVRSAAILRRMPAVRRRFYGAPRSTTFIGTEWLIRTGTGWKLRV